MYFKTGDNGGSVKLSSKFVRSTVLSGCHWQHSCCTLNAELSCNWEEKSNISRKRYLSGMEQPEPKHSQKKSNHSRPKKYWVAQNTKFWGIMRDFISSKFCLKIQARRPGRGIMDSGSTVMLGLLCQFDSVYRTRVRSLAMLVTHSLTHWLPNSLTPSRLVNLIDVTLACGDANSKLVEVVTVADVTDEDHVGNSLLQIWELTFGHKAKLLFRLWA